jgi:hypothetical protein
MEEVEEASIITGIKREQNSVDSFSVQISSFA